MTRLVFSALSLLLTVSSSHGFVAPQPVVNNKASTGISSLKMVDPFHALQEISGSAFALSDAVTDAVPASGEIGYSKVSYYTILGLYVMSFPGLWSQIKRSTSAKIKRKTFVSPGENAPGEDSKTQREQAGEIMAYMKANNYEVVESGETITFRGLVKRSVSQACFLVFCTALGMASLALVLQIQFQNVELPFGANWFYLVALSPYAGVYYWQSGDRVDDFELKLSANDDETENEIAVQGSEEEVERMWRTLGWVEKGMVKVEGLLENA